MLKKTLIIIGLGLASVQSFAADLSPLQKNTLMNLQFQLARNETSWQESGDLRQCNSDQQKLANEAIKLQIALLKAQAAKESQNKINKLQRQLLHKGKQANLASMKCAVLGAKENYKSAEAAYEHAKKMMDKI